MATIKINDQKGKKYLKDIEKYRGLDKRPYKRRKSDILYITGCTKSKKQKDPNEGMPAFDRYKGPASKKMLRFFKENSNGKRVLDVYVMSAGYGFIPADAEILDYDVTFANTASELKKEMAKKLELKKDFESLLKMRYKLIVLRIGPDYMKALNYSASEGFSLPKGTTISYLKTKRIKNLPLLGDIKVFEIPESESVNGGYQDRIWSTFFNNNKDKSTDEIINRIINSDNIKELLQ